MDDLDEGDFVEGVEFRYKINNGSYSQALPMDYVSGTHNPPLFRNKNTFSLTSPSNYTFQYRAVGANWQGDTSLTLADIQAWDLQFLSAVFNSSRQLTSELQLSGNPQGISCNLDVIPASAGTSANGITGTFLSKTLTGGKTALAVFSPNMLRNLNVGASYKIRATFSDKDGIEQTRFSSVFTMPSGQTAITGITAPKVELAPDAIDSLGLSVSSAQSQTLLLQVLMQQADGNDQATVSIAPEKFTLVKGNNEIVSQFRVPTGITISNYNIIASLWRDSNQNGSLDAGDQRITADKTFFDTITLYGGNDPEDVNNDAVADIWQTSNAAIDINADNDGDGRLNWHEYVFGSDPNANDDSSVAISLVPDPVSGLNFVDFTYKRRKDLDSGIYTILIETSEDMMRWEDASICFAVNNAIDHGDGTETVTFRCTEPTQNDPSLFIRARGLKKTINGGERFVSRLDVLLNSIDAKNNGYDNPGTNRYSNPYLRFTTGINLNTMGLSTIHGFFRHIQSVASNVSGVVLKTNKSSTIRAPTFKKFP